MGVSGYVAPLMHTSALPPYSASSSSGPPNRLVGIPMDVVPVHVLDMLPDARRSRRVKLPEARLRVCVRMLWWDVSSLRDEW